MAAKKGDSREKLQGIDGKCCGDQERIAVRRFSGEAPCPDWR